MIWGQDKDKGWEKSLCRVHLMIFDWISSFLIQRYTLLFARVF